MAITHEMKQREICANSATGSGAPGGSRGREIDPGPVDDGGKQK